jgi:hypothetical protein
LFVDALIAAFNIAGSYVTTSIAGFPANVSVPGVSKVREDEGAFDDASHCSRPQDMVKSGRRKTILRAIEAMCLKKERVEMGRPGESLELTSINEFPIE